MFRVSARTLAAIGVRGRGALPGRVVEEQAAALAVVARRAVPAVANLAVLLPAHAASRVPVAIAARA